ncbi:winged helix-turn-helix domain-containing protein [Asticcacaulis sp. AC402]|uniref:winged helix-turn-helix domain-containing protein n=1 Tax=Asticcacaulis sp. AC402 TaxID=1282361 RepID=UPI0003C3DEC1|nr:winged helix-turn-helix domain-containing protein [Asticcacaulis sp. AC402]ESQ74549.1 hypothetical protein ABAC402_13760 [Asticcacaulis sp. AC402]
MQDADTSSALPVRLAVETDFQLGRFQVRPSSREFGLDGDFRTLEPRVAQVLVVLVRAEGRMVSRDELIARCWEGRIVSESALNRVISRIRKLSQLDQGASFRLETIAKVGYRILAQGEPPTAVSAETSAPSPVVTLSFNPEQQAVSQSGVMEVNRRWLILGLPGVAMVAGLGVAWGLRPDPKAAQVAELLGQGDVARRMNMPDSDLQGVGFLEQAVALQPNNALAWGRLALARTVVSQYAPPAQAQAATAGAQDAARRALAVDPRQADAMAALALLAPYYGDWRAAEQRMNAVLAVHPQHLPTLDARDFLLVAVGRSMAGARSRLSYGPGAPLDAHQQMGLVFAHWILGQVGEADRVCDRALQLWPKHPGLWLVRLWVRAFTGRADRAVAYLEPDAEPLPNLPPWLLGVLKVCVTALVSRRPGDIVAARDAITATLTRGPSQSVFAVMLLCGLGEIDRAFDVTDAYLLDRGALKASLNWRQGQPSVNDEHHRKTNMLFVPVAAPMHKDPRFAHLMEAIGLTRYWDEAGVTPDHLA